MALYEIIETEAGLIVAEMPAGTTPENAALRDGGLIADPGPYTSYDEAYEALVALADEEEEEEEQVG